MEWRDVAGAVGRAAPMLGTLLGGPAGGAVGAVVAAALGVNATPDNVAQALTTDPQAAIKLAEIESARTVKLQELVIDAEKHRLSAATAEIQAVNTTMIAEAKAENWPTYSWRPFCGFVFGAMFLGVYFILPLFRMPVPEVPTEAWLSMGAVLGVASWHRGVKQAKEVEK